MCGGRLCDMCGCVIVESMCVMFVCCYFVYRLATRFCFISSLGNALAKPQATV